MTPDPPGLHVVSQLRHTLLHRVLSDTDLESEARRTGAAAGA